MDETMVFSATRTPPPKPPEPTRVNDKPIFKVSFCDRLMDNDVPLPPREEVDLLAKNLGRIELDQGNQLRPRIHIDDSVFEELCNPWKEALVVKLLDKSLGFFAMQEQLKSIWKLAGSFDRTMDREKVMEGGPWLIYGHCLAVSTWTPEFASPLAKVTKTLVWIRFPGLNLMYFDPAVLKLMATAIGKPIRVDTNTRNVERGCFARVCVEIDLTRPVVGKVWLRGNWYKVQYEGIHMICTSCGCYGHYARDCKMNNAATMPNMGVEEPVISNRDDDVTEKELIHPVIVAESQGKMNDDRGNPGVDLNDIDHGEWLVVTRKKQQAKTKGGMKSHGRDPRGYDNPFNVSSYYGDKKGKGKEGKTKPMTARVALHSQSKRMRSEYQNSGPLMNEPMDTVDSWHKDGTVFGMGKKNHAHTSSHMQHGGVPGKNIPPDRPTVSKITRPRYIGGGMHSMMPVKMISPNHFQFIDESDTEPPESMTDGTLMNSKDNNESSMDFVPETQLAILKEDMGDDTRMV